MNRGTLETIVGAMFAGKTSELLKRILWAEHQNNKILVLKPKIDDRYAAKEIIIKTKYIDWCQSILVLRISPISSL